MEFTLNLDTLGRVKLDERPDLVIFTSLRGMVGCLTTPVALVYILLDDGCLN